jgi:heme exporter protein A
MALIARNLSCERNGRLVFSGLNFSVQAGECVELRGCNGAGKSSLLRLLAGLISKIGGEVAFNGDPEIAQRIHFIAHQDALKSVLTVKENLQFWCDVLGGSTIQPAVSSFGLEALQDEAVQLLSAGQRRRLTLSRLFLADRPLWLLDEPMTALDAASQDELRLAIEAHLKSGGMVLAATHGDLGLSPHHIITLGVA